MKLSSALLGAASLLAISFAHAGEISGTVSADGGKFPLRGAEITVLETGQKVASGRDGSFRFSGLTAGTYTLDISYAGSTQQVTIEVASDDAEALANVVLDEGNVVVVRGQRGQLNSSIAQQRAADGVVTVLSADDIGQLPDENVAEAARRALGVSIANDQGEGRFISIRGINSQLNSTNVNGVRLTSPEAGDRRVGLDVIDADILKTIVINKTLSADMDGDAIGGTINLETISGLDREDRLVKLKAGGIWNQIGDEVSPELAATYVNNFMDGRLGVAASASFQQREFGSDNIEVDGSWVTDELYLFPEEELELRNYDITRERTSISANIDYMLTDNTRVYLNSLYNEFSDQEYRSRIETKIEDVDFGFDQGGIVRFVPGGDEDLEFDRDFKDRLEEQRIWSIVSGFEHEAGIYTFDGSVAFTHAEEEEPNRIDVNFDYTFEEDGQIAGFDINNILRPRTVFADLGSRSAYLDASNFESDDLEFTNGLTEDDELALTFNAQRDTQFGQYPGFLKAGAKARLREKSYDLDFLAYGWDDSVLADFAAPINYPRSLGNFGFGADFDAIRDFFLANRDNGSIFEFSAIDSVAESAVSSFEAEENIFAAYVMGQVDINELRITGGVRVEQTSVEATANVFDEGLAEANEDTPSFDFNSAVSQISIDDEYTDFLPSVQARYNVAEDVIIRAGYYRSLVRPNFGQFVPAGVINDDQELEAGNPELNRTIANNFDLLAEYYPTKSSIIQGGIFYKTLDDFIAGFESDQPGTFNGISYNEIESFTNLSDGKIFGVELGYQQALDFLPGVFDGFLVNLNYTYAESEATLQDGTEVDLPGQSENIFNAILGYEKGPINLRLAYSYKDENLDDVDVDGVGDGRIVLDQEFLDFSAKVQLHDNVRAYFDAKNLLDTPLEVSTRIGGRDFLNQYEEYGVTLQYGLLVTF